MALKNRDVRLYRDKFLVNTITLDVSHFPKIDDVIIINANKYSVISSLRMW